MTIIQDSAQGIKPGASEAAATGIDIPAGGVGFTGWLSGIFSRQKDFTDRVGEVSASPTANTVMDRLKALLTGISLAAGANIIGKVVDAGAAFAASGVTAVAGTVTAAGSSIGLTPNAGRAAYLWLSGGASAAGYFEWSRDAGETWFRLYVEGNALGTFAYAGASMLIPVPPIEENGLQVRVTFSAASGSVAYRLEQ